MRRSKFRCTDRPAREAVYLILRGQQNAAGRENRKTLVYRADGFANLSPDILPVQHRYY